MRTEQTVRLPAIIIVSAAFLLLTAGGCREEAETGIVFGEGEVLVGGTTITVDLALTGPQMEQGLKYRRRLPEDRGMLFIYSKPVQSPFWMKDTHIPLSIAFINREGRIISIQKMEPDNDLKIYHPPRPFLYALEMNQGWFQRNNIQAGDKVVMQN